MTSKKNLKRESITKSLFKISQIIDGKELRGVINDDSKEIIPCQYEVIEGFDDDGLAKVKRNGL